MFEAFPATCIGSVKTDHHHKTRLELSGSRKPDRINWTSHRMTYRISNEQWSLQFIKALSIEKSFTLTGHLMLDPFQQFIAERCTLLCDRDCIHFVLITFISLR